jgi:hypothetical protein
VCLNGIHQFAFGNHYSYKFADSEFDTDFSDSIECFEELEKGYKNYIPNFKIHSFLRNDRHAFEVLIKRSPNLLSKLSSCLLPPYRKPNVIKANLKFGNVLLAGRCGSCYKCALEYYLAHESKVLSVKYNPEYLAKCKRILKQKNVDLS